MEDIVHVALEGKSGSILDKVAKVTNFDCYKPAVRSFSENCFKFSEVREPVYSDIPVLL